MLLKFGLYFCVASLCTFLRAQLPVVVWFLFLVGQEEGRRENALKKDDYCEKKLLMAKLCGKVTKKSQNTSVVQVVVYMIPVHGLW